MIFSYERTQNRNAGLFSAGAISFSKNSANGIGGILSYPVTRTAATLLIGWQNRFMIQTYGLGLFSPLGQPHFRRNSPSRFYRGRDAEMAKEFSSAAHTPL
jgi:hypothetical protein